MYFSFRLGGDLKLQVESIMLGDFSLVSHNFTSMSSAKGSNRDLIAFNVLIGLAAVHFLVEEEGTYLWNTTLAYVIIWIMSLILLLWLRFYGGERGDIVDYDENLARDQLPIVGVAIAVMVVVSSVLISGFGLVRSALYVPQPAAALNLGQSNTVSILDDLLYNIVLVAPAEESLKLVGILALYRKTQNELISIIVPVGFWAVLHAYQSYMGPSMPIMVISAFVSGIILFLVLKYTRSLLNAQFAHSGYNGIIVLASLLH